MKLNELCFDDKFMSPRDTFVSIARQMNIEDIECTESDDKTVYRFTVANEIPQELFDSLVYLRRYDDSFRHFRSFVSAVAVSYINKKNSADVFVIQDMSYNTHINVTDKCAYITSEKFYPEAGGLQATLIHIYDGGKVYNMSCYNKRSKSDYKNPYPCSMKEFFNIPKKYEAYRSVIYRLFRYWGQEYFIWRDLAEDFNACGAYSSIPLNDIFACNNRNELMDKRYGVTMKRFNRETVGKDIFLARCKKCVCPDDFQILFEHEPGHYFINREKRSLIHPLADAMCHYFRQKFDDEIDKEVHMLIMDVINMSMQMKMPIRLRFDTLKQFRKYHDELAHRQAYQCADRTTPKIKIPKNSVFKTLRLPSNFENITTKERLIEEGKLQHNCVISYADNINNDISSIWSVAIGDKRYTVEIVVRRKKFVLRQMFGVCNTPCPDKYKADLRRYMSACKPDL